MKQFIYSLAVATTLLSIVSCDDNEIIDTPIPDSQKEMISFSLSDGTSQTRAGFKGSTTFIAMRIQSDKRVDSGNPTDVKYTRTTATANVEASGKDFSTITFTEDQKRYWDDAHGRYSLLSVYAVAIPNSATDIKTLENKLNRGDETNKWGTNSGNTIQWSVTTNAQTKDANAENSGSVTNSSGTIDKEDLVYSNNIKHGGFNGIYRYDFGATKYVPEESGGSDHKSGRMLFFQNGQEISNPSVANSAVTDASGKFDKGHLVFNHALSRLTIELVEGEGFDGTKTNENDFKFATGSNITLHNMYTSGTLDIKEGTWGSTSTGEITKMAPTGTHYGANGTYVAQMLPGYEFTDGNATNVMSFIIDGNTYFITNDMVYDALVGKEDNQNSDYGYDYANSKFTMQQGKNYYFKITVDKKKIDNITATLVEWVDVTAKDINIDNSHVTFSFKNPSGTTCHDIKFYRLKEDLEAIYTDDSYKDNGKGYAFSGDYKSEGAATLSGSSPYSTNWYYDNNRTAYHFRTINSIASGTLDNPTGDNPKSYFKMTGANSMPDYHWGAPMNSDVNLAYDVDTDKGYSGNIHYGVTSTGSNITITELHMMSNIYIKLETTTGSDAVNLTDATVKLTHLSNEANVDMGTGYITPSSTIEDEVTMASPTTYWETSNTKTNAFTYAVIPQALVRNSGTSDSDYVGITITTSDNNQYYVIRKLSEIIISDIKQGGTSYNDPDHQKDSNGNYQAIARWYPNHAYTYNIKLTKKGIEAITCTVADWVKVTGENIDIDLED